MNRGIFTVMDGEGHTAPEQEKPHLTVVPDSEGQVVFDASSSVSATSEASESMEHLIEDPQEYVRRMLKGPSHPGHPSERPHELPIIGKWVDFFKRPK